MYKIDQLVEILKHKGIGPAGSKSLSKEQAGVSAELLLDEDLNLTTRLTLLTAILTLEQNSFELDLIKFLKNQTSINPIFKRFLQNQPSSRFEEIVFSVIQRIDLNKMEAQEAMQFFFEPNEEEYLKAAFLEAQRLKRETTVENLAFLNTFWLKARRENYSGEVLLDFCNNYDGWQRIANYSTFTALFLAYCGIPTLLHGLDTVAPKNGYTSFQILSQLDSSKFDTNFNFLHQKDFFPELFAMKQMRADMVKRPFLATIERLLQPLRAKNGNYLIVGYTHPAYKTEFAKLLQKQNKTNNAIVVKGEEGSTQFPLGRKANYSLYQNNQWVDGEISPDFFGIKNLEPIKSKAFDADQVIKSLEKNCPGRDYALSVIEYNAKVLVHLFGLQPKISPNKENLESFLNHLFS